MFAEDENVTENQVMAQLKSLEKDIVRTAILKDKKRPNILNTLTDDHKDGLSLPKSTFWKRKKE